MRPVADLQAMNMTTDKTGTITKRTTRTRYVEVCVAGVVLN